MKTYLRVFGFLILFGLANIASAQITFTVTATANSSTEIYNSGSSYTFVFTLGNYTNLSGAFTAARTSFQDENTAHDQLWSAVGGTGLQGSYVRPTGAAGDPYSILEAAIPPEATDRLLSLVAATDQDATQTIGVTTLQGTTLAKVSATIDDTALPNFSMVSGVSPESYFSSYIGTYNGFTGSNDTVELYNSASYDSILTFSVTSLTISAVPEPSTYAAAFGFAVLAYAVWRRRKVKT